MPNPESVAAREVRGQLPEAAGGGDHVLTLEEQREFMALVAEAATLPEGVTVTETYAGGCRAYWNDPRGCARDRVVLYFHGGGYLLGSPKTHERLCGHIANAVGCRVLSVDYRLAPEHPHPAAVQDATAAYRWLLAQGYTPGHIAISGDSAGGGLTLATLLSIKQNDLPQPAAAVPLSPWADMEASGDSMTANQNTDLLLQKSGCLSMAASFLGEGNNPRDPLAAPLHGDYAGIPPIYFQVGGNELLLDDSTRVAERARAAGVEVKLDVFPAMQHVFQASVGNLPEATEAIQRIGAFLRPRLGL